MLTHPTLDQLHALGLHGMARIARISSNARRGLRSRSDTARPIRMAKASRSVLYGARSPVRLLPWRHGAMRQE
jgi:hypothetical protein